MRIPEVMRLLSAQAGQGWVAPGYIARQVATIQQIGLINRELLELLADGEIEIRRVRKNAVHVRAKRMGVTPNE